MTIITLLSAFFISAVAAYFSIAGLIAIFPGATIAVALMGSALELGKLVSASWIYRFWNKTNWLMKTYFISAIVILSFITSIGIFGYLTRAHVEGTQGLDANTEQIALLDEQIANERATITSSRQALQQMDAAVNNLVANEKTTERAVSVRNSQRKERENLTTTISTSNQKISELQKQKSTLNVGQRKLETEVGPIKYVAELVYNNKDASTIDKAVRLLILLLIFVFDPLAILLVVAANLTMQDKSVVAEESKKQVIPPTTNFAEAVQQKTIEEELAEKSTPMTDWNPGSWFKMVKRPK